MAYQIPLTIRKTLSRIASKDYVLPAIQREFVWAREPDRIARLFDSILRGYPIGTFLFWSVRPEHSQQFHFYEFMRNWHERDQRHNARLAVDEPRPLTAILDGQQRLTALNVGLHGSLTTKAPGKRATSLDAFPERHLYVDLRYEATADDDMQYGFEFLTEAQVANAGDDRHWFRVKDVLGFQDSGEAIFEYVTTHDLAGAPAFHVLSKLWKAVNEDGVVSYFEEDEQDLDRVLDIFVRVNSGGVVLTKSDLLLSIATAQFTERDAREEIHELVDDVNATRFGFNFTKDQVLKAGLVLTDISDVGFNVANFTAANMAVLDKQWDAVDRSLRLAARLLASFGFSSSSLTAGSVLIPIADYLHQRGHDESYLTSANPAVVADRRAIRQWVVRSILKPGIWGSALDQLLRALHQAVRDSTGPFPIEAIEAEMARRGKSLTFDTALIDDLVDTPYKHKRAFALLTLLYDWVDVRNEFHIDHVFPRSLFTATRLKRMGVLPVDIPDYRDRVERLGNLQLLSGPENVQKRAALPGDWALEQFPDATSRQAWLAGNDLVGLPDSIHDFLDFYAERRTILRNRLADLLSVDVATAETASPPPAVPSGPAPPAVEPPPSRPVVASRPYRLPRGASRQHYEISMRDLVDAELLEVGSTLTARRHGQEICATLAADGSIIWNGETFPSPSAAARAAADVPAINGWIFWRAPNGRLIADLRKELE